MSQPALQTLPPVLLKNGRTSSLIAGTDAVTLGLSVALSATSKAAELSPLVAEDLLRHLHRKLHEVHQARGRSHWFGGKMYNWALSVNLEYITLSGAHLRQVIALFDLEPPKTIGNARHYLLRSDIARHAHDALGTQLGVADAVLAHGLA